AVNLRRHENILKRLLVHGASFNCGVVIRQMLGRVTPRGLQGCPLDLLLALLRLLTDVWTRRLGSEGYGDRFEPNFGLSEPSKLHSSRDRERRPFHHGLLGDSAEIRLSSYPDRPFTGRVTNVSRLLDPSTRTAQVQI